MRHLIDTQHTRTRRKATYKVYVKISSKEHPRAKIDQSSIEPFIVIPSSYGRNVAKKIALDLYYKRYGELPLFDLEFKAYKTKIIKR